MTRSRTKGCTGALAGDISFIINELARVAATGGLLRGYFFYFILPKLTPKFAILNRLYRGFENTSPPVTAVTAFLPLNKFESAVINV